MRDELWRRWATAQFIRWCGARDVRGPAVRRMAELARMSEAEAQNSRLKEAEREALKCQGLRTT